MYDDGYDEIDGLGRFHKKFGRRLRKITKKLNPIKVFKKVTRKIGPVRAFKKITRKIGPVRMIKRGLRFSKRVNRRLNPITVFKRITRRVGPRAMLKRGLKLTKRINRNLNPIELLRRTGRAFRTAVPRGRFGSKSRRNVIIGGAAAAAAAAALYARNKAKAAKAAKAAGAAEAARAARAAEAAKKVKKVKKETSLLTDSATSPLTRKVGATPLSKSVVVNVSAPQGGGMFQTAQPRDSGGKVIRGKNDMIKKAAMIGIPAVLGVGALYMLMRKK